MAVEAAPDKVVAETAILLRVITSLPATFGLQPSAQKLLARLEPLARSKRIQYGTCLHPFLARDYCAAHIVLSAAGFPDPHLDAVLDVALCSKTQKSRERVPHRALEQCWLDYLRGGDQPIGGDIARTMIGLGIDTLLGSRDDLYAFTHALFYATDFGLLDAELPRSKPSILADIECAVAGALDDDDFDLVAELLMAWPILKVPWSDVASFAFGVIARVEDNVGILPSLAIDRAGVDRQQQEARVAYVTATTYHTAYVMGLLCALALRSHLYPSSRFASDLRNPESSPQWRAEYLRLPCGSRVSIAQLAFDAELRRAARRLDVGSLHDTLAVAAGRGTPATPLAAQSAALLRRLVIVDAGRSEAKVDRGLETLPGAGDLDEP